LPAARTHAASYVRHIIAAGLLSLLVIAGYANALANGFVWDDTYQILQNPFIRPGASWLRLFTSGVWAFSRLAASDIDYRPLQTLTYKATAHLFGFNAPAFHAVSLLFHLLTTLLVYAIACRLLRRVVPAAAAAALFALHPMHTEAVAWASALPELGCALFYLLAYWLFLLAEEPVNSRPRRLRLWASSYGSFFIALLWKEMALTLPLVIAVHCLLFSPRESPWRARVRRGLRAAIPYGAAFAVYLPLRWHALGHLYVTQRHWQLAPGAYAATVLDLGIQYVRALLWPVGLNAYHLFDPVRSFADPRLWAGVLVAALAAAGLGYGWRRRAPLAAFAALWILLTLIPVLNLGALGRNVFAERYLYLPSVGFCLLAVWLADKVLSRLPAGRRASVGACALILVMALYGAQTVRRNPDWRDPYTFFSTAVAASPNSPDMQNGLAAVLRFDRGDLAGAQDHYLLARTLAGQRRPPEWDQAEAADLGLGLIAGEQGDFHQALDWLDLARAADPDDPQLPSARAGILLHAGRWQEAGTEFQTVLRRNPDDANAWNGLGFIAWRYEHRDDRAETDFKRALRSLPLPEPLRASLEESLGAVQCEQGRCQEGVAHLQTAADLSPNDPELRTNLAHALQAAGRPAEARAELLHALALAPDYPPARAALAAMDGQ
jgi:Flp pilus assembly protein TadD